MTQDRFFDLAQKFGIWPSLYLLLNSRGEKVECQLFTLRLDYESFIHLLADYFEEDDFDVTCMEREGDIWSVGTFPVLCLFVGPGWESLYFSEQSAHSHLIEPATFASPDRQKTFACIVGALSAETSLRAYLTGYDAADTGTDSEITLKMIHNFEYLEVDP